MVLCGDCPRSPNAGAVGDFGRCSSLPGCWFNQPERPSVRFLPLGPNPASRRVSQGLETTEQTKLSTRPHPASRRWTAGLTTRHDKV